MKLRIYILDLKHIKPEGNFEAWARKERYEFFAKVLDETNAEFVLIAHNQDDLIETYIMQKKREKYVKNWGIAEKTIIFGAKIMRPLLGYTKASLFEYCKENKKSFGDRIADTELTPQAEALLTVDARPSQTLRMYSKFGFAYPFNTTAVSSASGASSNFGLLYTKIEKLK